MQNQPGSQGYHGLKRKIADGFMILESGTHNLFQTWLSVDRKTDAEVIVAGLKPRCLMLNGREVDGEEVTLTPGHHALLIGYRDVPGGSLGRGSHPIDTRPRSAVVLKRKGAKKAEPQPLAMQWHRMPGRIPFDLHAGNGEAGCYRFKAPPGLQAMAVTVFGRVRVWVDGTEVPVQTQDESTRVELAAPKETACTVAMKVKPTAGRYEGAAFPEPVKLTCRRGTIPAGDWSTMGVLKHYSGGMWYRRSVTVSKEQLEGRVVLDLGHVVATCEVHVNGKPAGVLLNRPFRQNITDLLRPGTNRLEILVYSTLSNHYQSTPTPYNGIPAAGLIGPVRLEITTRGTS